MEPAHTTKETAGASNPLEADWNGPGGHGWAAAQDLLDLVFAPVDEAIVAAAPDHAAGVLDVGCGTGSTMVALADHFGAGTAFTGIDISEPLLAAAARRAARASLVATFVRADAQHHRFAPGSFDLVVSRFGAMFFRDPVAGFATLRRATAPGGAMCLVVWRSVDENPFMTVAERAAEPLIELPVRDPDAPGQFAMADADRTRAVLRNAGWRDVEIEPLDAECEFPEWALVPYLTELGPLGRALSGHDDDTRRLVVETVRPAFDPFVDGGTVHFTSACWMVHASV